MTIIKYLGACAILSGSVFAEDGFVPLFDGESLNGWETVIDREDYGTDPEGFVTVHDGMIHMYRDLEEDKPSKFGVIQTLESYSHFHIRFDYKWGEKKFAPRKEDKFRRDAGLLYHIWDGSNIWPKSVECQVQEHDTGDLVLLETGATFTVNPALEGNRKTHMPGLDGGVLKTNAVGGYINCIGENDHLTDWNRVDVIVHGDKLAQHYVNGELVFTLTNMTRPVSMEEKDTQLPLSEGKIALQLEGAEIFYRNIEIKDLTPKAK